MTYRILVSNMGYARDIDGTLLPHLLRSYRHVRTPHKIQQYVLDAYREIIHQTNPDLCCMMEIDTGSFTTGGFDQFAYLDDPAYPFRHVSSKYAVASKIAKSAILQGKCNGFMAKKSYPFELLYLSRGSKRLIYRITLADGLVFFFTHLSLGKITRTQQMNELRALADREDGATLIAGDFNILAGLDELNLFLYDEHYHLLNDREQGTFTLCGRHYLLDLCLANEKAMTRASVEIIDQPFSDHDALLITIDKE